MSSDKPVVKPKTTTKKPPIKKSREPSTEPEEKEASVTDTSQDEEFARQLQEELLREQQEMDAELARRLQTEEQSKQPTAIRMSGPGGRPTSATPLQQMFQTLFGLTPRTMELEEEDEEDGTPAMDPDSYAGSRPPRPLGVMRPIAARNISPRQPMGRSPERVRRGLNRSPERGGAARGAGAEARSSGEDPTDLLPGVRLNPARTRLRARPRRIVVGTNVPQEGETEEPEGATNIRPISAIRRPGLGAREETMPLPDGEMDPDFMVLDTNSPDSGREDNFVNIMRDPFFLMLLLMGRHPGIMIPDDVDAGDYEALWDMAERLGEVRDRGMKAEEINKLPTRTYRQRAGAKPDKCSICLSDFKNAEKVQLLPCKHEFHQQCLPEWLKRNASCPVCRQDVKKPNEA